MLFRDCNSSAHSLLHGRYQLVDPGNLAMIAIAVGLVTWAGLRAHSAFVQQVQQGVRCHSEHCVEFWVDSCW